LVKLIHNYEIEKSTLLQKHKIVKTYLNNHDLNISLDEIHQKINEGYQNRPYNIYITDKNLTIQNTTYKDDLGFNLGFAKKSFEKHKSQNIIGCSFPIREMITSKFLSYSDSYMAKNDDERAAILQVSYTYENMLADTNKSMNLKNETLQAQLKEYEGKVIILSDQLTGVNNSVKSKDEKLLTLLNALDEKQTKYDGLIVKLQDQKAKIKSLTGIKLKVVAALKEALGDNVAIDRKSGSLRIASNILFDKGSAELKEGAKIELTKVFEEYIGTLVTNPKIRPHLDKIIIEGHTDSDGEYLYNLDLSQKRAFAVMNYLLTSSFAQEHNIKPLMIASGRAYLDAITLDGVEDKEASRRIEIKFRLKNEDAMQEIEKVLDAE